MMESLTQVDSTSDNNENRSNLTSIRGIGVSRKRWLNALGIFTIADLSQASATVLESQLKKDARCPSRRELEEWIAQAQSATVAEQKLQPQGHQLQGHHTIAPSDVELAAAPTASDGWTLLASFRIEYQTRQVANQLEQRTVIHHLETGAAETWKELESESIQPWILEHIETPAPQVEVERAVVPEITQLKLMQSGQPGQAMIASKTHPLFPGDIQANKPFALEVSIQFTEACDTNLPEQLECVVQCVAYDISTGLTTTLGALAVTVPLVTPFSHTVLLPGLKLPHAGIYRLKVVTSLQGQQLAASKTNSAYFKVPILQGS